MSVDLFLRGMTSSTLSLASLWVIEALTSFKQVDVSVLNELVKKVPEITGDLGKNAREMIYFRVLDTLASQRVGRNGSVSPLSENRFDPSESCKDVVDRMLHESTGDAEMYKLQLQNFITQKRAILEKCTLQKLKDAILEGKHPTFASLKPRSGLSTSSKSNGATGFSDGQNVAMGKNSTPNAENLNGQTVANGKNSAAPNAENLNGFSQEICQHIILTPSKRDICEIGSKDQTLNLDSGVDTNFPVTKKLKHDASLNGQAVSHECPTTVRDKSAEALVDDLELNHSVNERKDDENYHADMGTSNAASTPPNQAHKSTYYETNTIVEKSQPTPSKGVPHVKSNSDNFPHEAQRATDDNPGKKCSTGSDGLQNEMVHISARKCSFFSSQCTFTQDSLASDYCTELNLCMKCEKGGDLLICSANACPIVVHERCLGTAPSFDDSGKFFCPFCSYSHAISEYMEIKKKALLVRKDLRVFMGLENGQRPNRSSKKSTRPGQNQ